MNEESDTNKCKFLECFNLKWEVEGVNWGGNKQYAGQLKTLKVVCNVTLTIFKSFMSSRWNRNCQNFTRDQMVTENCRCS